MSLLQLAATLMMPAAGTCQDSEARQPHVVVQYEGIDPEYGEAIARLVEAARTAYEEDFGFDMPATVHVSVECAEGNPLHLFNDGQDRVSLSLSSPTQLLRPARSGVWNVYGFCHELGHIAMYRVLRERRWLAGPAAEGWALYAGSVVLDRVAARGRRALWPDRYDCLADGSRRLDAQLREDDPGDVALCAASWRELAELVGERGIRPIFRAWSDAPVDLAEPAEALKTALFEAHPQIPRAQLETWFDSWAARSIEVIGRSREVSRGTERDRLAGTALVLSHDDGTSDGMRSIAGSGHIVRFDAPPGDWYITAIRVFGSRYGERTAGEGPDVRLTLCDADLRPIVEWTEPYDAFERAAPRWYRIDVLPSSVPPSFAVCLDFSPTATRGVYVHFDGSSNGHSYASLPGHEAFEWEAGDWMIRVELDRPREADPLRQGDD